jgi:Arc/MetJ family transcription regulator
MRTNIELDDALMEKTMQASGAKTKRAAVEAAMQLYVSIKDQAQVRDLFGKIHWEGDLDESRSNKLPDDAWTR